MNFVNRMACTLSVFTVCDT